MKNIPILMVMLICIASIVIANGVGNEVEKIVNGFSFEFGIDPKEPKADEKTTMSLSVHNASTGDPIEINDLWVRISKGNTIFFTSGDFRIKPFGPMFFGYIFEEKGVYTIDFSAKNIDEEIKTHFIVEVKGNSKDAFKNMVILIIAFIFGFVMASFLKQQNSTYL